MPRAGGTQHDVDLLVVRAAGRGGVRLARCGVDFQIEIARGMDEGKIRAMGTGEELAASKDVAVQQFLERDMEAMLNS